MKKLLLILLTSFNIFLVAQLYGQAGTLDSSFGVNGKVTNNNAVIGYSSSYAEAVGFQSDGKILIAATKKTKNYETHFVVTRFDINGSIDSTFGLNGMVETYFDTATTINQFVGANATCILIQPDDKVIAGGFVFHPTSGPDQFAFVRYMPNGILDSSFGIKGKVSVPFQRDGFEREFYSLALQQDGKIIGGGWADGYCVIRLNSNGILDSAFGINGFVKTPDLFSYGPTTVRIQNDGKIVTGETSSGNGSTEGTFFEIDRMLTTGEFDSSFGESGHVFTSFGSQQEVYSSQLFSTLITHDEKIMAAGEYMNQVAIAKYKTNGSLDSSFGLNGKLVAAFGESIAVAYKIVEQKDGKLIVICNNNSQIFIIRLSQGGTIDSTYGVNGKAVVSFGTGTYGYSGALQPDGKLIATGTPGISLARFKGDIPITVSCKKNVSVIEGNTGNTPVRFQIVLNKPSTTDVFVNYATRNINAVAGSDYIAATGTLKIKAGKIKGSIAVNVIGDNTKEKNEKFALILSSPINAVLGTIDSVTCTIKNDDAAFAATTSSEQISYSNPTLKLYPNPVKDVLKIEGLPGNKKVAISITDISGIAILSSITSNKSATYNVRQLSSGLYYIRIENGTSVEILKFVKE